MLMDRRVRELVLISLLAAFCAGLAWHHDQKVFAAVAWDRCKAWEYGKLLKRSFVVAHLLRLTHEG